MDQFKAVFYISDENFINFCLFDLNTDYKLFDYHCDQKCQGKKLGDLIPETFDEAIVIHYLGESYEASSNFVCEIIHFETFVEIKIEYFQDQLEYIFIPKKH